MGQSWGCRTDLPHSTCGAAAADLSGRQAQEPGLRPELGEPGFPQGTIRTPLVVSDDSWFTSDGHAQARDRPQPPSLLPSPPCHPAVLGR